MSEPLDQGAKGQKTHPEIRCLLTCGPLFPDDCSESGTIWGLSWEVTEHVVTYILGFL
jgi:hypothetical protein